MGGLYILLLIIVLVIGFLWKKTIEVNKGRMEAEKKYSETQISPFDNIQTIDSLKITPIIDSEAVSADFKTENGVSIHLQADNRQIIMDVGLNKKKTHPSAFLQNFNQLGFQFENISAFVFSHAHLDHLGGMKEQKTKTFSLSKQPIDIPSIPVFAPMAIKPSENNPSLANVNVIEKPTQLFDGIYTIGTIPRHLFLMGYVEEQALAFNLKDKGIVLVVGCGHQTVQKIIERTQQLFDLPIYAVIGGLHFPIFINQKKTPFAMAQYVVGADYAPWQKGLNENDVLQAIETLKKANVQYVGLSPHDSSTWSINQFKHAFADKYIDVKVGHTITF